MKVSKLFFLVLVFASVQKVNAQQADSNAVVLLNQKIDDWVVKKNIAALDTMYAEDFRFSHGSGRYEGKAGWLKTVGRADYPQRNHDSVTVEMHPGIAIVRGIMHIIKNNKSRQDKYQLKYVRVYQLRNNNWKLISHITTHEHHE